MRTITWALAAAALLAACNGGRHGGTVSPDLGMSAGDMGMTAPDLGSAMPDLGTVERLQREFARMPS